MNFSKTKVVNYIGISLSFDTMEYYRVMLNELSNTVVFERPSDEDFVRKWQLACEGPIAHAVVMPNVTPEILETFVKELVESRNQWKAAHEEEQQQCLAYVLGNKNCMCEECF